ncbi:MAG: glycosyltransferase family A protein [Proteocatella sp.]
MSLEVIISCMHQKDNSIINNSNLNDVVTLVINQCDTENDNTININELHRILNTRTRGLSVSRNLGIMNAKEDICVISDDDETFVSNLKEVILSAYEQYQDADIIAFMLKNHPCSLGNDAKKLNKLTLLKIASCQITFRRQSVIDKKIFFDTKIGSGTGNGAGEENKFLLECYKAGLKIYYYPTYIATLNNSSSQWFHGYDENYFFNDGKTNRYVMGFVLGLCYSIYFLITKRKIYDKHIPFWQATKSMLSGFMYNDLRSK